ncbi:flavin reductase family protein [uncultured Hydrogenophaga sp.]|uniref:flavin reductase family protein n=1 Tax=uncultured Hydrogenophaga sp. TaxID=199683 RepID=UPI00258E4F6E|nr:flavin reductase family protein [uncultured Hydrogenophaga sp.]
MRQAASPVCVVTTRQGGQRMALTISSFLSVSADPPLVSVCINRNSRMCEAMTETGHFGVHLLAHDQAHVADTFAGRPRTGEAYDFNCVEWVNDATAREPAMCGVSVSADCHVVSTTDAGSHRLFIATVTNIVTSERRPLIFWNRVYGFPSHPADPRQDDAPPLKAPMN